MSRRLIALSCLLALGLVAAVPPRPGEQDLARARELLARFTGEWDTESSFMGLPPSQGHESVKALRHGLSLVVTSRADMGPQGQFEGHGLIGFDPRSGKWLHVWTDNREPGLSVSEGQWTEDGSTFFVDAEMDMGGGPQLMRMATRVVGPDALEFTMAARDAAAGVAPMMTMSYRRAH